MLCKRSLCVVLSGLAFAAWSSAGLAEAGKKYGPGVSDTEIRIGNTAPYSGPASALGATLKSAAAYLKKVNDEGGVNGRKINFISYDDAYSPPKTVEQTRRLVEGDEVLLIFGSLGTAPNSAVQKYLNQKSVPQLFIMSGATKFGNPKDFPWTMGWPLDLQSEGRIAASYVAKNVQNPKIGIIYQNDDFGRDIQKGFREALGPLAPSIVSEVSYETSDPTIDSQIVKLKTAGADVVLSATTPKFSAQVIRKSAELGWKPVMMIPQSSGSVGAVLKPAGLDNSEGVLTWLSYKDPTDVSWRDDPGFKAWSDFMSKYYPDGDWSDISNVVGYLLAQSLVQVLKEAGDDLTRDNIMRKATSLKGVGLDMLLPGITLQTSASDYFPIEQAQIEKFTQGAWQRIGDVLSVHQMAP
jgi:branched-chain amino acid transport system substrate-binding protein